MNVATEVLFSFTDVADVESPALPDGPLIRGAVVSTRSSKDAQPLVSPLKSTNSMLVSVSVPSGLPLRRSLSCRLLPDSDRL